MDNTSTSLSLTNVSAAPLKIVWLLRKTNTHKKGYGKKHVECFLKAGVRIQPGQMDDFYDINGVTHPLQRVIFDQVQSRVGVYESLLIVGDFVTMTLQLFPFSATENYLMNECYVFQEILAGLCVCFGERPLNSSAKLVILLHHAFIILSKIRYRYARDPVTYEPSQAFTPETFKLAPIKFYLGDGGFSVDVAATDNAPGHVLFSFENTHNSGYMYLHIMKSGGQTFANHRVMSYEAFADLILYRLANNTPLRKCLSSTEALLFGVMGYSGVDEEFFNQFEAPAEEFCKKDYFEKNKLKDSVPLNNIYL
jgi:hypothetical protein